MERLKIYQATDPTCIWCWGNEPLIRALDYLYGDKVDIEFIMGGLVEDITTLYHTEGDAEQRIKEANRRIHENNLAASTRHGMPICRESMALYTEQYRSSFPQNIAYEAAKRIDAHKAKLMLRRLREATLLEGRRTSQMDQIVEIATQVGFKAAEFIEQYTSSEAQIEFTQDRMLCQRNGISGFPSYIVIANSTKVILSGYQTLATLHNVIARLTCGTIKPRRIGPSLRNVAAFIKHYGSVFPVEIEVAFSLDRAKTDLMIDTLLKEGKIDAEEVGTGTRLRYSSQRKKGGAAATD
jgi:protein-disulfide isomerase-like protein with CxxC motif